MQKNIFTIGVLIRLIVLIILIALVLFITHQNKKESFDGGNFVINTDTDKEEYLQQDILDRKPLTEEEKEKMGDSENISINIDEEDEEVVDPEIIKKAEGINSFQECKDAGFKVTTDIPPECWAGEKGFYEIKK